jgi:tetrapyrrole methylase family protein/MazG family protein
VVGLGPGPADLVTAGTLAAIDGVSPEARFLRTTRHPSASVMAGAASLDDLYASSETFDDVYRAGVERLVAAATYHGSIVYAVPGSPRVLERTVDLLEVDPRVDVDVLPAMSFVDLVWHRLRVDPIEAGVRLVDGHRFAEQAAGEAGPLLVGHCHNHRVLSDVKLAYDEEAPASATVLQRLGLADEAVFTVDWADLDRSFEPDHLTTVFVPAGAPAVAPEMQRFVDLVRRLRADCPWDREQTHASLTRHLVEETYETVEAIAAVGSPDGYAHLEEELGDLLFQVVFHATLAAEEGAFAFADVVRGIHDKLVHRHPHVFGDAEAATAADVMANWELSKRTEKGRHSVFDGIPSALPALLFAYEVQRKAAAIGVEAAGGDAAPDDIGAALFALVAAARRAGVDPETALRDAAVRFRDEARATES